MISTNYPCLARPASLPSPRWTPPLHAQVDVSVEQQFYGTILSPPALPLFLPPPIVSAHASSPHPPVPPFSYPYTCPATTTPPPLYSNTNRFSLKSASCVSNTRLLKLLSLVTSIPTPTCLLANLLSSAIGCWPMICQLPVSIANGKSRTRFAKITALPLPLTLSPAPSPSYAKSEKYHVSLMTLSTPLIALVTVPYLPLSQSPSPPPALILCLTSLPLTGVLPLTNKKPYSPLAYLNYAVPSS